MWWSDFYDRVYQHPDCPDESVIQDDEALDHWCKETNREYQNNKKHSGTIGDGGGKNSVKHSWKFGGRKK